MKQPNVSDKARLFDGVVLLADVTIGDDCGVWPNVVMRGDVAPITVGARSNIQDGSVVHCDAGVPTVIGEDVTVGHMCLLHSCTIGDASLIGMGSIVMNNVKIGKNCLIGAGSLVTNGTEIPDGMMAFGRPAKVVRPLTPEEIEHGYYSAKHYVELMHEYD